MVIPISRPQLKSEPLEVHYNTHTHLRFGYALTTLDNYRENLVKESLILKTEPNLAL